MHTTSLALFAIGLVPLVAGHCKITAATGDKGGSTVALGLAKGSGQSLDDVTVYVGDQGFGKTNGGGAIDPAKALPIAMGIAGAGVQLPQMSVGGAVSMTLHQVNADGAGAFACSVDPTAAGTAFQPMTVTTNVAGTNGKSTASDQDFPLIAAMPAAVTACTGTVGAVKNVCMVKCQNPAGPFGGTVAVQMAGAAGAAAPAAGAAAPAPSAGIAVPADAANATSPAVPGSPPAPAADKATNKGEVKNDQGKVDDNNNKVESRETATTVGAVYSDRDDTDATVNKVYGRGGPVAVRAVLRATEAEATI